MLTTRLGFWAPSSPHPPQHSSDFATKLLAEIWTFGQKRHDPFISISTPNTYPQAFQQLIRKPQKALGQNYTWSSYFGQCIFFPQKYFIRLPSITSESRPHYNHHCSLSSENPDEAFLLSLWRWQFKSSTGWHDNSNTQFSLLSPSVAETLLAGLPGKTVAKETAVHSSPILSLAEGHCCAILGPLLSKTSLAT